MTVDDKLLTADQQAQIKEYLGGLCAKPLEAFCAAAIAEFADAVLNRRSEPATVTQQRLYRIVKHALNGTVPSEAVVSRLMGITERRALGMIQTVTNRYRSEFEKGFVEAAKTAFVSKETVKDAEKGTVYRFNAPQVVVDYLKEVISVLQSGKLAPIQKVRGSAEIFEVSKDTYDAVCTKLVIPK